MAIEFRGGGGDGGGADLRLCVYIQPMDYVCLFQLHHSQTVRVRIQLAAKSGHKSKSHIYYIYTRM